MDSGAFHYNLDSVFTQAVLESDFEGLRLLAFRNYAFRGDDRLEAFVKKAFRKGQVEPLSLLRSLGYDLSRALQEKEHSELQNEGSVTVDFLGSRNAYRFSLLELATTSYAEKKVQQLCKQRTQLYKAARRKPITSLTKVKA